MDALLNSGKKEINSANEDTKKKSAAKVRSVNIKDNERKIMI